MRRRQPGENGVGLERAVFDRLQPLIECVSCGVVVLVPRGEGGNGDAGVRRGQRRTLSRVSRTRSAVSGESASSGTATTPTPRFLNCIGVGAISISRRPSFARMSMS